MRRRLPLLLLAIAAGIALGWWLNHRSAPTPPPATPHVALPAPLRSPAPVPPPVTAVAPMTMPVIPPPPPPQVVVPASHTDVPIQDGRTIDFSSGKPIVKDSGDEKAIIDAAVKEMDEAAKHVRFGPNGAATGSAPAPAEKDDPKKLASPPATPSGG